MKCDKCGGWISAAFPCEHDCVSTLVAQLAAERERRQREGDEADDLWQSKLHAALAERDAERKLREAEDALTHRPSSLDLDHTACGLPLERFPVDRNLKLGEGETCQRCTHVVAAVAKERAAQKQAEERVAGLIEIVERYVPQGCSVEFIVGHMRAALASQPADERWGVWCTTPLGAACWWRDEDGGDAIFTSRHAAELAIVHPKNVGGAGWTYEPRRYPQPADERGEEKGDDEA
mgnify:FL=1